MKYKFIYFVISILLLVPGLISLAKYGLKLSIDFTGGSLIEIETRKPVESKAIIEAAGKSGVEISSVQSTDNNSYLLRTVSLDQAASDKLVADLNKSLEGVFSKRFETVGPTVGAELTKKALMSVVIASVFIVLYIAWAFRSIPKPYTAWKFGASAVIALLHDALVVLGIFSILGHFLHVEIDALFVTALLTIIGFSVHDTIVVFDRIRENLPKMPKSTFEDVVDFSLTETIGRSLNTSLTVLLTLSALLLFGGETIRWFVVALTIGIASGTFSSIFNAAPILVLWESAPNRTNQKT
jgi:preprotein translocase subunit SecF